MAEWIKKTSTRNSFQIQWYRQIESKRMEKSYYASIEEKKTEAVLISHKVDFKAKKITGNREGRFITTRVNPPRKQS